MELVEGGELFDYVARRQRLDEGCTVFLFRQIVCALLYCHRLHIHHRDLKPENILLDYREMCVKLVDFGMAALQPTGNLLTTPCGSPHYAAPELLSSRAYDGGQADVWSCGVVLFVMLTGYPPFNFPSDPHNQMAEDKKLKALFRAIHNADYKLPSALSIEAKDLLQKIFITDPRRRITIDQIWHHPFLHKYDGMFSIQPMKRIESLIGPQPTIESWVPLTAKRIDPDIFRALRTLWHSETPETLIRKLCNDEPNQEKYFYNAMLKYREENLEDFQKSSTGVEYSASDYQHSRPAMIPEPMPEVSDTRSRRSKSTFSICGSEHLQSRHSFYEIPVSEASYDPFRASREPITKIKPDHVNITVRRVQSNGSRRTSQGNHGSSLRVEVLRRDSRRSSTRSSRVSSTSASLRGSPASRGDTRAKRSSKSVSRISVGSSALVSSSPLTAIRRSDARKRSVQFSYLQKSSTATALTCADSDPPFGSPARRTKPVKKLGHPARNSFPFAPSPAIQQHSMIRSRKENPGGIVPTPRTRKIRDIDQEARKVSSELGKACEEAFFRSSISSSGRPSFAEKSGGYIETPPSSVSKRSPYEIQKDAFFERIAQKPLPPTPAMDTKTSLQTAETPGTYTAREMRDLRERLAARYEMEGTANDQRFNDVLNTLDVLMSPIAARQSGESQRTVSAPQPRHDYLEDTNYLSVIPEEGRFADNDELISKNGKSGRWPHRAFTEPPGRPRQPINKHEFPETTIRLVQPSSPIPSSPPQPWAPLNIRKQSSTSSRSESRTGDQSDEIMPTIRQQSCKFSLPRASDLCINMSIPF
jgi:serine/threonine-protein kinase HSL1 (negative regulator of Swe1 kinase)